MTELGLKAQGLEPAFEPASVKTGNLTRPLHPPAAEPALLPSLGGDFLPLQSGGARVLLSTLPAGGSRGPAWRLSVCLGFPVLRSWGILDPSSPGLTFPFHRVTRWESPIPPIILCFPALDQPVNMVSIP